MNMSAIELEEAERKTTSLRTYGSNSKRDSWKV